MAIVKKRMPTGARVPGKISAVAGTDAPVLELPLERSKPLPDLADYAVLLFGAKKIGKTTLVSCFDQVLFLMSEPGGKGLSIYQRPVTSWDEFRGYVKLLVRDTRFKGVCVDTVDLVFKQCEAWVCRKLGISHPSDEEWGKGWGAVKDEFTREVQKLLSCGKGVFFISHSTEREIKSRDGRKYDRIQPTMSGQARDVIEGFVDLWAYYDYEGGRRVLTIRGNDEVMAGCRLRDRFMWKDREVTQIDMGTSVEEGHTNFIQCFNNQYNPIIAKDEAPVVPTTSGFKLKKR